MTPIYLERREPARNRQRFYVILGHPDPVRRLGAHPGVGPDRSSGDGAGEVVCDGRRGRCGRWAMAATEGTAGLPPHELGLNHARMT